MNIPHQELESIRRNAEVMYPDECCGILVGSIEDGRVHVRKAIRAANVLSTQSDRFEIAPEEILRAMDRARAAGEEIVGYYHSHPDREARPSRVDRREAWPGVSYLIASVMGGTTSRVRSWRLDADGSFSEEPITESGRGRPLRKEAGR